MAGTIAMIGAVALLGAAGGVVLGNFVAAGGKVSGADELAAYFSTGDEDGGAPDLAIDTAPALGSGPSSYQCEGCDAGLHKEPEAAEMTDYLPLPSYEVVDLPLPARRADTQPAPVAAPAPAPRLSEPPLLTIPASPAEPIEP